MRWRGDGKLLLWRIKIGKMIISDSSRPAIAIAFTSAPPALYSLLVLPDDDGVVFF